MRPQIVAPVCETDAANASASRLTMNETASASTWATRRRTSSPPSVP